MGRIVRRIVGRILNIIKIIVVYISRFIQCCLFWIPVKKNRVLFYIHERKGYTCNLKYIVEKLLEHNENGLELIWTCRYPDSVRYLEKKNIRIIRYPSLHYYWKHFTSKVLVTNDSLTALMRKRRSQYLINTVCL